VSIEKDAKTALLAKAGREGMTYRLEIGATVKIKHGPQAGKLGTIVDILRDRGGHLIVEYIEPFKIGDLQLRRMDSHGHNLRVIRPAVS
jgi:hypothetical protein